MSRLPGGFGPKDRRAEYVRALHGELPTAFTVYCSAQKGACRRVRAVAMALPRDKGHALVLLPTQASQLPVLVPRDFNGAVTAPLCPRAGHNRFYEKDIAHIAPGAPKAQEDARLLEGRFAGGVTRTVILCMNLGVLRPGFEEYQNSKKPGAVRWCPGEPGTLLKPEWQRTGIRVHLNEEAPDT